MLGIIGVTGFPNYQLFRMIDNWGWGLGPEIEGVMLELVPGGPGDVVQRADREPQHREHDRHVRLVAARSAGLRLQQARAEAPLHGAAGAGDARIHGGPVQHREREERALFAEH